MTNKQPNPKPEVPVHCSFTQIKDIDSLVPNPRNPNVHPPVQIELLAKIIKHQGWRNPIVVSKRSGFIVKGHGRYEAAKKNGYKFVPVDMQNYENEAAEHADMIADNRIAELSIFDDKLTQDILATLKEGDIDMELTGYQLDEIDKILEGWEDDGSLDDLLENDEEAMGKVLLICPMKSVSDLRDEVLKMIEEKKFKTKNVQVA